MFMKVTGSLLTPPSLTLKYFNFQLISQLLIYLTRGGLKPVIKVTPEESMCVESEKLNGDVPVPNEYLDFMVSGTREIMLHIFLALSSFNHL